MTGHDLLDRLDGIVHENTQVHDFGVDLTVDEIYRVAEPGRVDFGGGELEDAELEPVETSLRDSQDDYEWWNLDAGTYLLEHNESLEPGAPLHLQTRRELRGRGAYHPSVTTTSLDLVPLTVADGGIRIKENARVSTLMETR